MDCAQWYGTHRAHLGAAKNLSKGLAIKLPENLVAPKFNEKINFAAELNYEAGLSLPFFSL